MPELCQAALFWLRVPRESLGRLCPERRVPYTPEGRAACVTGLTESLSLPDSSVRLLLDEARRKPWWTWLSETVEAGVRLDGLPPELLPEHTVEPLEVAIPDMHCHLFGGIPISTLWMLAVTGAVTLRPTVAQFNQGTSVLHDLVGDAAIARWQLAGCVSDALAETWDQAMHGLALDSKLAMASAAEKCQLARWLALRLGWVEVSGYGRYADPFTVPIGDAPERALLHAAVQAAQTNEGIRVALGRYLYARSQFQQTLELATSRGGLDVFVVQFARLRTTLANGISRGDRSLLGWCVQEASRHAAAGGATAVELKIGLGAPVSEARKNLRWARSVETDIPTRFVAQLNRGASPKAAAKAAAAIAEVAAYSESEVLAGMDLVGPEAQYPPMMFRNAYALTDHLREKGFAWHVHAGEQYAHPLTGLRWISWCLRHLRLGQNDRLAHVLATIIGVPRRCFMASHTRYLDLLWCGRIPSLREDLAALVHERLNTLKTEDPGLAGLPGHASAMLEAGDRSVKKLAYPKTPAPLFRYVPDELEHVLVRAARMHIVSELSKRKVVCDVCPSSNYQVGGTHVSGPSLLPFHRWPTKIRWLVGTDDPGLLETSLRREVLRLFREKHLAADALDRIRVTSEEVWPGSTG